jgi:predicted glycosyltransferase
MTILIDINHPAHVHYFKNCIRLLRQKGHRVIITTRNRYPARQLLKAYGEEYYDRGKGSGHLMGKLLYIPIAGLRIFKIALKTRPALFLSFGTPYPNQVAWLLRKPGLNFQDTENAGLMLAVTRPFSRLYCTPSCFKRDLGKKQIRFNGYMELSYLHPRYFTPDDSIYEHLGIRKGEKFVVLRFVSWRASHDIGHRGIGLEMKRKAVKEFSRYARVFISSESQLPEDLRPYRIGIPPERMHDALAYAALFWGESATMASESAVLGTPALYLDNAGRGYTEDQENRYGLVFNYSESPAHQEESIHKAVELLKTPGLQQEWQRRRRKMLAETIDVTAFMVWLIENYPQSADLMRMNPGYQDRFMTTLRPGK